MKPHLQQQPSVYVALTHEVLKREQPESIADLADAVKAEAARLRIHYTPDAISSAIAHVLTTTGWNPTRRPIDACESPLESAPIIGRDEARAILERLGASVKSLPAIPDPLDAAAVNGFRQANGLIEPHAQYLVTRRGFRRVR